MGVLRLLVVHSFFLAGRQQGASGLRLPGPRRAPQAWSPPPHLRLLRLPRPSPLPALPRSLLSFSFSLSLLLSLPPPSPSLPPSLSVSLLSFHELSLAQPPCPGICCTGCIIHVVRCGGEVGGEGDVGGRMGAGLSGADRTERRVTSMSSTITSGAEGTGWFPAILLSVAVAILPALRQPFYSRRHCRRAA